MNRIRITTQEPEIIRGIPTVQHWQLFFDDLFLCDTSVPEHLHKWKELQQLIDQRP